MRLRSGTGKYLMKKAMGSYLPPDILYRPKMGFVTPISNWFRGPLATEAAAIAGGSALARTGWFDGSAIAKAAADHKSGLADHGRLLWRSEEHTSELQSLMRNSYAVFCLKKKNIYNNNIT